MNSRVSAGNSGNAARDGGAPTSTVAAPSTLKDSQPANSRRSHDAGQSVSVSCDQLLEQVDRRPDPGQAERVGGATTGRPFVASEVAAASYPDGAAPGPAVPVNPATALPSHSPSVDSTVGKAAPSRLPRCEAYISEGATGEDGGLCNSILAELDEETGQYLCRWCKEGL